MTAPHMTPRERVLAALRREPVDRVPWIEGIVGNGIASAVCREPIRVDWSVAPDGLPVMPGDRLAEEQKKVNRFLGKDNLQFCAFAPIFCTRMTPAADGSPVLVGDGLIRSRDDLAKRFRLPSPTDPGFIAGARAFIARRDDYCACACIRLGIGATLLSMGLEGFAYAMADDPDLIATVHGAYVDWTAAVVPVLEEIGFDVIWAFDDVAFNAGPVFSPAFYRDHILPRESAVTSRMTRPLITHSDGNMTPLLDLWLGLGQDAIHPIQPDVMDIRSVKAAYGDRVALVGNVSMDDLVHADPEAIRAEVLALIRDIGRGNGYIVSSSNSLTDAMNPANVLALRDALRSAAPPV